MPADTREAGTIQDVEWTFEETSDESESAQSGSDSDEDDELQHVDVDADSQERRLLADLAAFHIGLDKHATLRVCCVCGEERGAHIIPDKEYQPDDPLLEVMDGELVRPADPQPLRICTHCRSYLVRKRPMRPPHALHFPPPGGPCDHRSVRVSTATARDRALARAARARSRCNTHCSTMPPRLR